MAFLRKLRPSHLTSERLREAALFCSGAALLVFVAIFISNSGLDRSHLGAAVITSQQTFNGTQTLSLTASNGTPTSGQSVTLTWNATGVTDVINYTFCLTDGTACNSPVQTLGTAGKQTILYSIGGVNYLLSYSTGSISVYKWSGTCWGDAAGTCGNVLSSAAVPETTFASYFVGPDGNSYLAVAAAGGSASASIIYKWNVANQCWGDGYTCDNLALSNGPAYTFQSLPSINTTAEGISTATINSSFYLLMAKYNNDFSRLYKWTSKPLVQQISAPRTAGLNGYTVIEKTWALDPGRTVSSVGVYLNAAGSINTKVKIVKAVPIQTCDPDFGICSWSLSYSVVVDKLCPTSVVGWNDCTLTSPYTVPSDGTYYVAAYNGSTANGYSSSFVSANRAYIVGDITTSNPTAFTENPGNGEALRATYQSGGNYFCFGNGAKCGVSYQGFPAPQGGGYYAYSAPMFSIGATTYMLSGDYSGSPPHLFKWMTSTMVPGWYTNPPNSGYGSYSVVDADYALVPGSTVTKIGFYSSGAQTGTPKIKIFRRNGFGSYDVVYDQAVSHTGGGWIDFTLTTPFAVPTTGEYYAGVYTVNNAGYSAAGGARAYLSGDQLVNSSSNLYNDDQSSSGIITRATYSAAVECFGDGTTCGAPLQTFPVNSPIGQPLNTDTSPWKIFTSGADTYAAEATNDNDAYIFKWNATSNCFGSLSGNCGVPYQEVPNIQYSTQGNDGWNFFTYAGTFYGMLQQVDNGTFSGNESYLFRWMNVSMQQGGLPTTVGLGGNTSLHRQLQLVNGATVTKIGVYYVGASASMNVKVLKRNSASNYDVVLDQVFTHPGTGWYDVPVSYTVPASGDYYPGVYSAVNIGTFSYPSGAAGSYTARAYKGANVGLSAGQSFSEDNGGNSAPALRATYNSNAVSCFGDGVSICNNQYINLPYPALPSWFTGLNFFNSGSTPYIIISTNGGLSTYKFASIPCFGNASSLCASATSNYSLQTLPTGLSTNDWEDFTIGSTTYLAEANGSGGNSPLYQWMPVQTCLGDGTTCGNIFQNIALNGNFWKSFTANGSIYVALAGIVGVGPSNVYKWMPAGTPVSNTKGCIGDGVTCGQYLQTFAYGAYNALGYTIPTNGNTYLSLMQADNPLTYKLMPGAGSGGKDCFGDGTTCGTASQSNITPHQAVEWNVFTTGGSTYLVDTNQDHDLSRLYKWTPSCANGGGWGDGTTCAAIYETIGPYDGTDNTSESDSGITYSINGSLPYLTISTNGVRNTFWGTSKWISSGASAGCPGGVGFGDGGTTCDGLYSSDPRANSVGMLNIFTRGTDNYLIYPIRNSGVQNIFKWTTAAGCPATGGWGSGSVCGSASPFQQLALSATNDAQPFTDNTGTTYMVTAGTQPTIYKFIDATTPSIPACTVSWSNASGSGTLASGDSNLSPGVSTGPITQSTTYILTCNGAGSVSVPVTLQPGATITATPPSVASGGSSSISWTSFGVDTNSCKVEQHSPANATTTFSGVGAGDNNAGQSTGALNLGGTYSYTVSCTTGGGAQQVSNTATVGVQGATVSASPSSVNVGSPSSISWTTSGMNTSSCGVSQTAPSGTTTMFSAIGANDNNIAGQTTGALGLSGTFSYKLTCTAPYTTGNNGTLYSAPTAIAGKLGQAYTFNGASGQYFQAPYNSIFNQTSALSLSLWVKTAAAARADLMQRFGAGNAGYAIIMDANGTAGDVCMWVGDNSGGYVCTAQTYNDGNWHNIVGTYNGTTVNIYVDGVLKATGARTNGLNETVTPITAGSDNSNPTSNSVDDIRIYSRALSVDEAATLAALGPVSTGLVAYWPLDTNTVSGTTAYDEAGGITTGTANVSVSNPIPPTLTACTTGIGVPSGCDLYLSTTRVRSGGTSQLSWSVTGLTSSISCSITSSPNISGLPAAWNQLGASYAGGPTAIGPVTKPTTVTLSCTGGGTTTQVQKSITLVPAVQEI